MFRVTMMVPDGRLIVREVAAVSRAAARAVVATTAPGGVVVMVETVTWGVVAR